MTNQHIFFQYIVPVIITSGLSFLTVWFANKRTKKKDSADVNKTDAETHNLYVNDEINLANFYKQDIRDLRKDFTAQIDSLKATHQVEINTYKAYIVTLEDLITDLRNENEKYKNVGVKVQEAASAVVEASKVISNEVK